jgi:hypothetical protein
MKSEMEVPDMSTKAWALPMIVAVAVTVVVACAESSGDEGGGENGDTASFDVSIGFSETATQEQMDAAAAFLRGFDEDVDFLLLELFPPIGRGTVTTDDAGFCDAVRSEFEGEDYVRDVTCGPHVEPDDSGDPDEPVSSDDDG